MKYSLINIDKRENGRVSGNWVQNCCGVTLVEAMQRARDIEKANSNKIQVAVVDEVATTNSALHYYNDLVEITNECAVEVLGMTPEISETHARLRTPEAIFALAEAEGRELIEAEQTEALAYDTNLLRIKVIPNENCVTKNTEDSDERIDSRFDYGNHIPLICNECGAVFSTKNIQCIGARSIFGFIGRGDTRYAYPLLAEMCKHKVSSLRLATDDELAYFKALK